MGYLPTGNLSDVLKDTYQLVSPGLGYLPAGNLFLIWGVIMQNTIVMAFRKRMKSCGYTDIHIIQRRPFNGEYVVKAVEPLASVCVSVVLTRFDMHSMFRF